MARHTYVYIEKVLCRLNIEQHTYQPNQPVIYTIIVLEISYGDLLELLQEFNLLKARPCITDQLTSSH